MKTILEIIKVVYPGKFLEQELKKIIIIIDNLYYLLLKILRLWGQLSMENPNKNCFIFKN